MIAGPIEGPAEIIVEESRRWLFEPDGFWGFTIEHYNRTDGLTPGWGFALEPTDPTRTPGFTFRVAAPTTHQRLYWRLATEFRLPLPGALVVRAEHFQRATTFDDWKITTRENDVSSFVAASDLLDWWRERGSFIALDAETSGGRLGGTFGYLRTKQWSQRNRAPFSLFGGDDDWRDNPAIEEGELRSLLLEGWLDTRDVQSPLLPGPGWIVRWTWEGAGRALGGDIEFSRGSIDVRRYIRLGRDAWWDSRIVWKGPFGDEGLPTQRKVQLGGPGSLRGFRAATFQGDAGIQAQSELRLPLPVTDEIAVVFLSWHWVGFIDVGRVAEVDNWGDWHADVGTGLSGINIFSYIGAFVAQRITDLGGPEDGPRFIVRLRRDF
ncbi:MAG: BamA/TamA family outer membrane protein [Gemmatimonadota bacterium]